MMAGAQIRRFLILHKELDADDGELTRTLKVRRSFVAERYATADRGALRRLDAKNMSRPKSPIEDGRKGTIRATVQDRGRRGRIRPASRPAARLPNERAAGADEVAVPTTASPGERADGGEERLAAPSAACKAITDISFDVRKGEIRAIIGPNGAGKTSMLNVINGFYTPQKGDDHLPRRRSGAR